MAHSSISFAQRNRQECILIEFFSNTNWRDMECSSINSCGCEVDPVIQTLDSHWLKVLAPTWGIVLTSKSWFLSVNGFDGYEGVKSERFSSAGENGMRIFTAEEQRGLEYLDLILTDNFWKNCSWGLTYNNLYYFKDLNFVNLLHRIFEQLVFHSTLNYSCFLKDPNGSYTSVKIIPFKDKMLSRWLEVNK